MARPFEPICTPFLALGGPWTILPSGRCVRSARLPPAVHIALLIAHLSTSPRGQRTAVLLSAISRLSRFPFAWILRSSSLPLYCHWHCRAFFLSALCALLLRLPAYNASASPTTKNRTKTSPPRWGPLKNKTRHGSGLYGLLDQLLKANSELVSLATLSGGDFVTSKGTSALPRRWWPLATIGGNPKTNRSAARP